MCTAQSKKSLFSPRSSSGRRVSGASTSCPNSPRRSRLSGDSVSGSDLLTGLTEDEVVEVKVAAAATASASTSFDGSSSGERPPIQRSASTTNAAIRPRTAPAGLYSYTGALSVVKFRHPLIIFYWLIFQDLLHPPFTGHWWTSVRRRRRRKAQQFMWDLYPRHGDQSQLPLFRWAIDRGRALKPA